jgi:hypothetical protein
MPTASSVRALSTPPRSSDTNTGYGESFTFHKSALVQGFVSAKAGHHRKRVSLTPRANVRRSCSSFASSPNSARFSPDGVTFTDPRRADARRSCARACVHRRWCYMQRTSVVHPGAIGVSRPWQTNRSCKCVVGTARRTIRPTLIHGGMTVAALVRRSHRRRIVRDFHRTGLTSPIHDGLTFRGHGCSSVVAEPNPEFTSH